MGEELLQRQRIVDATLAGGGSMRETAGRESEGTGGARALACGGTAAGRPSMRAAMNEQMAKPARAAPIINRRDGLP